MEDGKEQLRIRTVPGSESLVYLHPDRRARLRLGLGMTTCFCSVKSTEVAVLVDTNVPRDMLVMTEAVSRRLCLHGTDSALFATVRPNRIRIGPLIGILCHPMWRPKEHTLVRNRALEALEKLVAAASEQKALGYLFRLDEVDFEDGTVLGYIKTSDGWKRRRLPLPDVIYDQMVSRKRERSKGYAELREQLSNLYGQRIFNDGFFDKWTVHDWLQQDKSLRPHIPQTVRYTQAAVAVSFLQRFPVTFLKPVHGSLGLGIVRIVRHPDGSYNYDVNRAKQPPMHGSSPNVQEVVKVFRSRLAARPYVLQQGIALAQYQDRPFDIRILLQRDGSGEWRRTKMFARVAKVGDFTSNISSGGEALPVHTVFTEVFKRQAQAKACQRELMHVTRRVTEVMEKSSGKVFGEMGLDIGVDQTGHIWVIEANSKPWKSPTTEKGRQDLVDLSFTRPIEYAVWLAQ